VGGDDHLVARADPEGGQAADERARPGVDRECVLRVQVAGERALEVAHAGALERVPRGAAVAVQAARAGPPPPGPGPAPLPSPPRSRRSAPGSIGAVPPLTRGGRTSQRARRRPSSSAFRSLGSIARILAGGRPISPDRDGFQPDLGSQLETRKKRPPAAEEAQMSHEPTTTSRSTTGWVLALTGIGSLMATLHTLVVSTAP